MTQAEILSAGPAEVDFGAHVADTMVEDLITIVEHEKAAMGVLITLTPPT